MREVTDMPAPYFAMPRAASQEQPHGRVGSRHGSERVQPGRQATTKARGEEESMLQHLQHLPQWHGSNSTAQSPPLQQQVRDGQTSMKGSQMCQDMPFDE